MAFLLACLQHIPTCFHHHCHPPFLCLHSSALLLLPLLLPFLLRFLLFRADGWGKFNADRLEREEGEYCEEEEEEEEEEEDEEEEEMLPPLKGKEGGGGFFLPPTLYRVSCKMRGEGLNICGNNSLFFLPTL